MLELKNIKKRYATKYFKQTALNGVSLLFRKNEFVAILGPSGSGKTTLLNIVGGLDRFDSGDIIVNGKSTKKFKNKDWDAYRNTCIGFIFQSYNLIGHISVLANIEMGMTLAGLKGKKRHQKAMSALARVGLKDHAYKKPNQLSGGQMQRVAIARALVNDPDIILADEPTGALDSKTSTEVMNLIKEISQDKLVIMVTHNKELADEYASRVIELRDGMVENDSRPLTEKDETTEQFSIRKVAMGFFTALKLSFNNIRTKKGRTLLTAFASSIGIIGIALILSLSNGLQLQIDEFERGSLSQMPIMITPQAMQMDEETMQKLQTTNKDDDQNYTDKEEVYPMQSMQQMLTHNNTLTEEYADYVNEIDSNLIAGLAFTRGINLNVVSKKVSGYAPFGLSGWEFLIIPEKNTADNHYQIVNEYYDVIAGHLPENKNELLLIVDFKNRINEKVIEALGFRDAEKIDFNDILDAELRLVPNDDYYQEISAPNMNTLYIPNANYEEMYNNSSDSLKITGIIRGKKDKKIMVGSDSGLSYTSALIDYVYEQNKESNIVKAQEQANYNIMSGEAFEETAEGVSAKEKISTYLGGNLIPSMIQIYPKDFDSKDKVIEYLDKYNDSKETEEKIVYTDMAKLISTMSGSLMNGVTYVLIGFSGISLVVSSIMIGIITYISVLERTKEIGVLRALGARKKDISRVFNAETFIIGAASGFIGIAIAYLLTFPVNVIILNLTELKNVAKLNPLHALFLIVISLTLTLIGGFIPASIASRKDPVAALRTE